MIEQMVQRLAARLDQDGSDLPGWLKLVRAYSVLDRKDDAVKALQRAKSQFNGNAAKPSNSSTNSRPSSD